MKPSPDQYPMEDALSTTVSTGVMPKRSIRGVINEMMYPQTGGYQKSYPLYIPLPSTTSKAVPVQ